MAFSRWLAVVVISLLPGLAFGWDYAGHRMVNEAALKALPQDFPSFVREPAAIERIAFLSGEPDRWRNVADPIMKQSGGSWCDHFIDVEQIPAAGLDINTLPSFRYDFIVAFAAGRAAHADHFPVVDPEKNSDHTREWPGFAPWAIDEYYARLKSAFSYLKTFEENGSPDEIANARANAIYLMGVMGHFVADLAQPLHTTDRHNGWIGNNPEGYTQSKNFHSLIDGTFLGQVGTSLADVTPHVKPAVLIRIEPRADGRDPVFVAIMDYLLAQHALVEPLYRLEKAGKFSSHSSDAAEGRAFLEGQLGKGAQMLASLWLTAWRNAPPDVYLKAHLLKYKASGQK